MFPQVTICICTRNRPEELRRCLDSIVRSSVPVAQVVVSDDSTDVRTEQMLADVGPMVQYFSGPRRGLGANRNCALDRARGSHVLFLDDDATLGEDFLREALACMAAAGDAVPGRRVIVSGVESNFGTLVFAHDQSFLGHQNVPYPPGQELRTIVINSTLFPRGLFEQLRFDEKLVYGYDEVDVATRAIALGYRIAGCHKAVNFHYPSTVNRDYYRPHTEASRLYVTLRRYARHERKFLKAAAFSMAAPLHLLVWGLRHGGPAAVRDAFGTILRAGRMLGPRPVA